MTLPARSSNRRWMVVLVALALLPLAAVAVFKAKARPLFRDHWGLGMARDRYLWSVSFSADSSLIASGDLQDNSLRIWETETGREIARLKGPDVNGPRVLGFSSDGRLLYSGDLYSAQMPNYRKLRVWNWRTGTEIRHIDWDEGLPWLALSTDGRMAAAMRSDSTLHVWDTLSCREKTTFLVPNGADMSPVPLAFKGNALAAFAGVDFVRVWEFSGNPPAPRESAALDLKKSGNAPSGFPFEFAFDGRRVAFADSDPGGPVRILDVRTGTLVRAVTPHGESIRRLAFSPDGTGIATGSADGMIRLWDLDSGLEVQAFRAENGGMGDLAFSPDGRFLASDAATTLRLWKKERP